jgi:rhodanese-related sulfurtransferase
MYIVAGLAVAALVFIVAFAESTTDTDNDIQPTISASDIVYKQAIEETGMQDAVLLDVRTPEEYSQLHAVGSILFEVTRLDNGELPRYPADQKIYVYCRSGNRSARAVDTLRKAGFTDVIDIGALADWQAAGGPVQSS